MKYDLSGPMTVTAEPLPWRDRIRLAWRVLRGRYGIDTAIITLEIDSGGDPCKNLCERLDKP